MRLSMTSWIIKTEVCVLPKPKAEADNTDTRHPKVGLQKFVYFKTNRRGGGAPKKLNS